MMLGWLSSGNAVRVVAVAALLTGCGPKAPPAPTAPPDLVQEHPFPLVPGLVWRWRVEDHTPKGRALLFFDQGTRIEAVATWTLSIEAALPDGRYRVRHTVEPVDGDATHTEHVLWRDGDTTYTQGPEAPTVAFGHAPLPPSPAATEQVACSLHLLGLIGTCSPAPGGTTAVPPLPARAVVDVDRDALVQVVSAMTAILTVGIVAPGGGTTRTVATLEHFEDPTGRFSAVDTRLLDAYRAGRGSTEKRVWRAVHEAPVDRNQVAALITSASTPVHARTLIDLALPALHPTERDAVVRVAVQTWPRSRDRLKTLVRALPHLALRDAGRRAAMAAAMGPDAPLATCLLDGSCPFTVAFVEAGFEHRYIDARIHRPTLHDAPLVRIGDVALARFMLQHVEDPTALLIAMVRAAPDRGTLRERLLRDQAARVRALDTSSLAELTAVAAGIVDELVAGDPGSDEPVAP